MKPTIGRIVHYVLHNGKHRPAIVVDLGGPEGSVHLNVFAMAGEYLHEGNCFSVFAVAPDEERKAPYSWHWPEREPLGLDQELAL